MRGMMKNYKLVFTLLIVAFMVEGVRAQEKPAPPAIASGLIVKLLALEKTIGAKGDISIHVIGNADAAALLTKAIGTKIGGATLKSVTSGDDLPGTPPSVIFLSDETKVAAVIEYTRANKVLSVTNMPNLVSSGVTLGIAVGGDGKPKVLLNTDSSNKEGRGWNPALMKIAKAIK